ncbi:MULTISPECIES: hypothetical protein [Fischerella]|uniref:Uncharacterized protein n=1 Tax=Fischerella muscicola CCMEE 5323 TaxID=2019572 RepID=A0A2N6K910_FISMU|nr:MULTISPECIES: hypothetical protein [Fischerella]PLZ94365.1 hypothetical protein CEN44_00980 [Fischerella muscicola CCMEE 5323]
MTNVVVKPSSWLTTGIRVEKVNNLNLFKFTKELGARMQELLDKNLFRNLDNFGSKVVFILLLKILDKKVNDTKRRSPFLIEVNTGDRVTSHAYILLTIAEYNHTHPHQLQK